MNKARIFLAEDNPNLGFTICDGLEHAGFLVDLYADGVKAAAGYSPDKYDICLLDIMLPKMDGFALAELIRTRDKSTPILFLTAKNLEEDKLKGFGLGGDDYITKPFSMKELVCRIEVFLKRTNKVHDHKLSSVRMGEFTFSHELLTLEHGGEVRTLTSREADVLRTLWENHGGILKREELLNQVWGDDDYFMGRSLDVFISRLRKYLQEDPSLEIRNYHGIGFALIINKQE